MPYNPPWQKLYHPQPFSGGGSGELTFNIVNIKLVDPAAEVVVAQRLEQQVNYVEVVDRVSAYEASPGYSEQQSTLNTQRDFTLLIGILVVGGLVSIRYLTSFHCEIA